MNVCVGKETRLNIRVKPNFKDDLQAVADYHGLTVSSYVHSVLVKAIREEKTKAPEAFVIHRDGIEEKPSARKVGEAEDFGIVETALPFGGKLDDEQAEKPKRTKKAS